MAKGDFIFEKPEESTGFLLWRVNNLWQREIRKALERFDLTHAQFVLLAGIHWLTLEKKGVTQIVLANHTGMDPMTTSTVLRALQAKDLIAREEHHTDTRAKAVVLTATGIKTVKQAVKTVEQFDQTFFSTLQKQTTAFNQKLNTLLVANTEK